jgi:hypothetical protein
MPPRYHMPRQTDGKAGNKWVEEESGSVALI